MRQHASYAVTSACQIVGEQRRRRRAPRRRPSVAMSRWPGSTRNRTRFAAVTGVLKGAAAGSRHKVGQMVDPVKALEERNWRG